MNGNLKVAVQKKGRLAEKSILLLKNCGLDIENYQDKLIITASNFPLDILFLRDDDIPEYVQDGVADIGIVGENIVLEKESDVEIVTKLGFGKCKLQFGVPEEKELDSIKSLEGKTIATSYPNILKKYLVKNTIDAKIIKISGSVEIAPALGVADFICDLISTGNTLKLNKLKKSFEIMKSEAVLIKNKNLFKEPNLLELFDKLLLRIESSLNAKNSKYLMMNINKANLPQLLKIIPSLKSPTVLPLAEKDLLAVHAVIPADKFWKINYDLKKAGASGILLLPIENIIL